MESVVHCPTWSGIGHVPLPDHGRWYWAYPGRRPGHHFYCLKNVHFSYCRITENIFNIQSYPSRTVNYMSRAFQNAITHENRVNIVLTVDD